MLTVLRKIRKSLIDSSATRKYFFYAFGEIALVVIGILIALQINNWNENRKLNEKEAQLVKALHTELEFNLDYHIRYLDVHLARVDSTCRKLLAGMGQQQVMISENTLKVIIADLGLPLYTQRSAKFMQIIEGEDFNVIRNDSLRDLFMDYRARINLMEVNNINSHKDWQKIMEHLTQFYSRRNILNDNPRSRFKKINDIGNTAFSVDNFDLLNDLVFENQIIERLENNQYWANRMTNYQNHLVFMINFIERNYAL